MRKQEKTRRDPLPYDRLDNGAKVQCLLHPRLLLVVKAGVEKLFLLETIAHEALARVTFERLAT
ncbi:hypothetical protein APX70_01001, partial [Pseudomonas syringae pv. maculicola]